MPKTPLQKPDTSSVRTLIKQPSKLARHLQMTPNGIRRWINVNRIPASQIINVANFYDVELADLMELCSSDTKNTQVVKLKPRTVLPALLMVKSGAMSLDDAVTTTEQSERSLKLILIHWGDELHTLYRTLEDLDQDKISLETACIRLKVAKYTLHGLRRKYGYAPGPIKKSKPETTINARKQILTNAALDVIAGRSAADPMAKTLGVSVRNLFRYIERLTEYKLVDLAHWPTTFRAAYARELMKNTPKYVEKWLKFAKDHQFMVKKQTKYPPTPTKWKEQSLKRMLLGILLGEASLEELAEQRGADPGILANLFTSDLRPLDLTFPEVQAMHMDHQLALADLLLWQMDRKRVFVEAA